MTCIAEGSTPTNDAVWLNIESKRREADGKEAKPGLKVTDSMLNLTSRLKDLGFVPRQTDNTSTSSPKPLGTLGAAPAAATLAPQIEKLCSYFHSQLQRLATSDNSAIYSETTNTFDHFVYKCPCPPGFINKTLSLKQILRDDADQRKRESRISKFKLARLLALGVLRFQSTPWVRETLNSEDIHFLVNQLAPESQGYSLEDPFIRVQLSRETGSRPFTAKSGAFKLSRNELLFNLGVILLELGYDAPLQYLRSTEDIKEGETEASWYTDFFTARRLGKSAPSQLDARYGKLAKKCVDCDFGVGEDLNSMELQSAVLRDVVTELDKCIKLEERINSLLPMMEG